MIRNKSLIASSAYIYSTPQDYARLQSEDSIHVRAVFIDEFYPKEDYLAICIKLSELVGATQLFLTEIVSGMAMLHPQLRNELHVSTQRLAPQFSSARPDSVWVPPYPVKGVITREPLGFGSKEYLFITVPYVELLVDRGDKRNTACALALKVTGYEHLELLTLLMHEASEFWSDYESAYKITPSSANALENNDANELVDRDSYSYAMAMLEQFKGNPDELENFILEFRLEKGESAQDAIVAAVVMLNSLYALADIGGKVKTAKKRNSLFYQMKTLLALKRPAFS